MEEEEDACIGLMLFDGVGLAREVSDRTLVI